MNFRKIIYRNLGLLSCEDFHQFILIKEEKTSKKKTKKKKKKKNKHCESIKKIEEVETACENANETLENNCSDDNIENDWTYLGIHPIIAKRLYDCGFKDPTSIQREAIPPAIQSRMDIVGAAETVCYSLYINNFMIV